MDTSDTGARPEQQQEQAWMDLHEPRFFVAGGTLAPDAASYLPRAADDELFETLMEGQYAYMLDSRQKGKSSLVARTQVRLEAAGVKTIKIDLQSIGSNLNVEQWYASLVRLFGRQLGLEREAFACWGENHQIGPFGRWLSVIEQVVLPRTSMPLVVFVDEVDFVRSLPFSADEFFAGIRECYNRRSRGESFTRLTFCLIGSATPSQLVQNVAITPFNIGREVKLTDFTRAEMTPYAVALRGKQKGEAVLDRIYYWTRGHPYLTQAICAQIAEASGVSGPAHVDRLVEQTYLSTEARQREPNLLDVSRRLLEAHVENVSPEESRGQMLNAYKQVLSGKKVLVDDSEWLLAALRLCGAISDEAGKLSVRNEIYRRAFDRDWIRANMPDAELRRQRGAARRAMLRTATVAGIVVAAVSAAAMGLLRLSNERQVALTDLGKRTAELSRVADERQKSLTDLEKKTEELKRVSAEKQKSLTALQKLTNDLRRVSDERQAAVVGLQSRTVKLAQQSYREQMAVISAEIAQNRWMRVSAPVERSQDSPYRGWEWGYAALQVNLTGPKWKFPKWSVLEPQPNGPPLVASPFGVYDLSSPIGRKIQDDARSQPFTPVFRIGNFRVQNVDSNRGDIIRDTRTNHLYARNQPYSTIRDIDPKNRLYMIARDRALETIEVRTIDEDKLVVAYTGPNHMDAARFLPDGTFLSIHTTSTNGVGDVRHWDRHGNTLDTAPSEQYYARGLTLSRDGSMYVAWGYDGRAEIRLVKGHQKVSMLPTESKKITHLVFSKDGREVLTGCEDGAIRLYDVKSGRFLRIYRGHRYPILQVAFIDDSGDVASIDSEGNVRIWEHNLTPVKDELKDHADRVDWATLDAAGKVLISASYDGTVVSHNLVTNAVARAPIGPQDKTKRILISRGTSTRAVFVKKAGGRIDRLEENSLRIERSAQVFPTEITTIQALDAGKRLFVGSVDRKFAILDGTTLRVIARIEPRNIRKPMDSAGVTIEDSYAFDNERDQLALFLGTVGKIQVYSSRDGRLLKQWNPVRAVHKMIFTNNGTRLVASLAAAFYVRDGRTVVYDPHTTKEVCELKHPGRAMTEFEYSPKANLLVALSGDRSDSDVTGFVWDTRTFREIGQLTTYDGLLSVCFSPDGERLLTNSMDGTMRIWNSRTCEEYLSLRYPGTPSVGWAGKGRFTPDGRRIIQFAVSGFIWIWNSLPWQGHPSSTAVMENG